MLANRKIIAGEMEAIADENGGIIRASDVVDKAQDRTSEIHKWFSAHNAWDSGTAKDAYQLNLAYKLIVTVRVKIIHPKIKKVYRVRSLVSLPSNRMNGGGYRFLIPVLNDAQSRAELLDSAMVDLKVFEQKYSTLHELSGVFAAMKKVSDPKAA